jgi:hypothetical protein
MLARTRPQRRLKPAPWHSAFLAMLPQIVAHARISFRYLNPEARQEAVQEAVCNALRAFVRLVQLGKADIAYPTVLARYAVAQVRDGRQIGTSLNVRDVSSEYAQRAKGIVMERLDRFDQQDQVWEEILIPDRTCTPAELAASRIDFPAWLDTLKARDRKIALKLAEGQSTSRVSRQHHLSAGRISQLRRELAGNWRRFISDKMAPAVA